MPIGLGGAGVSGALSYLRDMSSMYGDRIALDRQMEFYNRISLQIQLDYIHADFDPSKLLLADYMEKQATLVTAINNSMLQVKTETADFKKKDSDLSGLSPDEISRKAADAEAFYHEREALMSPEARESFKQHIEVLKAAARTRKAILTADDQSKAFGSESETGVAVVPASRPRQQVSSH